MVYNWNLLSVTSFDRLCHFWDTLLVDEVWSATRQRSRTSNHGRYLIVSRAYASSWDLWVTTGALFRILLTLRRLWWPWLERTFHLCGTRVVRLPSVFSGGTFTRPELFRLRPANTLLIQMLVILAWVECWARSRTISNTLLPTVVTPFGPHSDVTAPLNARCWPL